MSRRKTVRVDEHDGPWSVSVAENQPSNNYSLYIQTPTHLLTLTRSASEIAELHAKLLQTDIPSLPPLPLNSSQQNVSNKRRSSFLTTLSRLAAGNNPNNISNNNNNTPTKQPLSPTSPRPSIGQYPTPAVSPAANDIDDPFTAPIPSANTSATSTGLAAYLTAVSNHPSVRTSRAWRRFVRVRTDDLESVRVERSIKRVRSDVAMHHPQPTTQSLMAMAPMLATDSSSIPVSDVESTHTQDPDVDSRLYGHAVHSFDESIGTGGGGASVAGSMHDLKEEEEDDDMLRMREDAKIAELIAAGQLVSTPLDLPTQLPLTATSAAVFDTPVPIPATVAPNLIPISTNQTGAPVLPPVQLMDPSDLLPTPSPSPPTPTPQSSTDTAVSTNVITTATVTIAAVVGHRIPRSASADPDRASRLSRVWVQEQEEHEKQVTLKKSSLTPKTSPSPRPAHKSKRTTVDDFEMMRVLGKGCAGKVLLVKHKASGALYALKAITKRHVLAHQELQHTLTEQAVLKRMAHEAADPFVVKLWWSFHDKENLFLVMDFHPGGDLATQLARWGRLGRDRARFYAAEIVEGVEGLHAAGVVYRDLKPENILIGADGHIVLTDFGLSKEFPRRNAVGIAGKAVSPGWIHTGSREASARSASASSSGSATWVAGRDMTTTFCGTAEYLAPEVIQGLPYSYEVDWWSFGTMLYEMLTGITPFWANNHSDMYVRVLQDELQFPDDKAMDQDTKSLIRGVCFQSIALSASDDLPAPSTQPCPPNERAAHKEASLFLYDRLVASPYIPPIDPSNASDTQNFDEAFLDMDPTLDNDEDEDVDGDVSRSREGSPPLQKTKPKALTHRIGGESDADVEDEPGDADEEDEKEEEGEAEGVQDETDVFDGYSFKGRISVIIDDDAELDGVERSSESEAEGEEESVRDDPVTVQQESSLAEIDAERLSLDDSAASPAVVDTSRPAPIKEEIEVEEAPGAQEMQADIEATPISLKPSLGHSVASDVPAPESEQTQGIRIIQHEVELPTVPVAVNATDPDGNAAISSATPALVGRPASVFVEGLSENDIISQAVEAEADMPAPAVPSKDVPAPTIPRAAAATNTVVESTSVPITVSTLLPKTAMRQPVTDPAASTTSGGPPKPAKAVTIAAPPARGLRQTLAFGKSTVTSTPTSKPSVGTSDDEDEGWDFVENPGGEDRNGARGTSLFARGVVDRYRLAVFRKSSSSGGAGGYPSGQSGTQGQRVASSASRSSATAEASDIGSPESSEKRRGRGRLGKSTRTFLRARSPAPTPPAVPASPVPVHVVSSSGIPTLGSLGLSSNSSRLRSPKNGNGYPNLSFNGKRSVSVATGSSASALGSLATGSGSGTSPGGPDTSSANTTTTAATTITAPVNTLPHAGPSLKSKDSSMSMSPSGISGSGSSSVDADGELGMSIAYSGGIGATDTIGTTYTTTTATSVSVSASARTSGIRVHDIPRTSSLPVPHPESGYLSSGDASIGGGGNGGGSGGLFGIGKRNTTSGVSPMSPTGEEGKKKKMKKYKEGAEKVLSLFGSPRQDKERERERIAAERQAQMLLQQQKLLQQQQQQQLNVEPTPAPIQTQAYPIQTPPSPIPQTQTPVQMHPQGHLTETRS